MIKPEKYLSIEEYNYQLPDEKIARYPLVKRDISKLLVYENEQITETDFKKLPNYLPEKALVFFNNTRVVHARLNFYKNTGANIEIFCLSPHQPSEYSKVFAITDSCVWNCLVGNLKKWKSEPLVQKFYIDNREIALTAFKIDQQGNDVRVLFKWDSEVSFGQLLEAFGKIPIPPYLGRESESIDNERYQTIYSSLDGSVAAPTAGLHFTRETLDGLKNKNIRTSEITLHVGAGTFQPVKNENVLDHPMHGEFFQVTKNTLEMLYQHNGKIISTGTTTLRCLESLYWLAVKSKITGELCFRLNQFEYQTLPNDIPLKTAIAYLLEIMENGGKLEFAASTQIMIVPGYTFKVIDGLITNFHQPRSTLLLLVAALAGDNWKKIYNYALNHNFRFLSYGDSSLLWR